MEIGGRAGGVTGVSRDTPITSLTLLETTRPSTYSLRPYSTISGETVSIPILILIAITITTTITTTTTTSSLVDCIISIIYTTSVYKWI